MREGVPFWGFIVAVAGALILGVLIGDRGTQEEYETRACQVACGGPAKWGGDKPGDCTCLVKPGGREP